jgi:hypothetical protein
MKLTKQILNLKQINFDEAYFLELLALDEDEEIEDSFLVLIEPDAGFGDASSEAWLLKETGLDDLYAYGDASEEDCEYNYGGTEIWVISK